MKVLENGDLDISSIINVVSDSVRIELKNQADFKDWVRKEQSKVDDPKARSYSIFAQLVCLD